jgi:hypothetical protein
MLKYIFLLITLPILLNANKCTVDTKIMYSILLNESYSKKSVGYKYIISFNNPKDAKIVRKTELRPLFLNSRNLDCKNEKICVNILKELIRNNITNLDLGPYQINYFFHKLDRYSDYFNLKSSYLYACSYVADMINKHGYNWYAIASYHSQTPDKNQKYRDKLIENYKGIK